MKHEMKQHPPLHAGRGRLLRELLLMMSGAGLLLGGCVMKPTAVPTRHFVLAPIADAEKAPISAGRPSVEISFVKMPSYLLRDSMVVRKSGGELDYLETALWAERLDHSFRQTLAENLSILLASGKGSLSATGRDQVMLRISVDVQQFDVDTEGRGTLVATWRLTAAGAERPINSGEARFMRRGPAPHGNPQAIAQTLSSLVAEFSHDLAQALIPAEPEGTL